MQNAPIYGLNIHVGPDGISKAAPMAGYGGYASAPLGSPYVDVFGKTRAPNARQLLQNLVGTAWACANINANFVASNQLKLWVRTRKGESKPKDYLGAVGVGTKRIKHLKGSPTVSGFVAGDDTEIQEVTNHPLLDLLMTPEPEGGDECLSGYDLLWLTQLYLESVGRGYWWKEPGGLGGTPSRLWALPPHLVWEMPDLSGKRAIAYYEFGAPGATGRTRYEVDEIVRFAIPHPFNPYIGAFSPMMAAFEKIGISRKEDAHVNAMLENMGRPDALFTPKGDSEGGGIGPNEAQRQRSAFRSQFAMAGRGSVMVSEFPGTLEPIQWPTQDIVEIERSRANKTDVANCFDVPDAMLEANEANRAVIDGAMYQHARWAGVPRCERIERKLNHQLVPLFDKSRRLFFAYEAAAALEDKAFELEQTKTAALLGVDSYDEIRQALGQNPIDGKIGPLHPTSNTIVLVSPDGDLLPTSPPPAPTASIGTPKPSKPKTLKRLARIETMIAALAKGRNDDGQRDQTGDREQPIQGSVTSRGVRDNSQGAAAHSVRDHRGAAQADSGSGSGVAGDSRTGVNDGEAHVHSARSRHGGNDHIADAHLPSPASEDDAHQRDWAGNASRPDKLRHSFDALGGDQANSSVRENSGHGRGRASQGRSVHNARLDLIRAGYTAEEAEAALKAKPHECGKAEL